LHDLPLTALEVDAPELSRGRVKLVALDLEPAEEVQSVVGGEDAAFGFESGVIVR
jgi:hypothetical protein